MGSDCTFRSLTFGSCGLGLVVLLGFTRGVFRCRLEFDESHPKLEDVGNLSASGVGNLIGDLFPFVRRGVVILSVEGDPNSVEVDGVLIGAIGIFALLLEMPGCK